MTKKRSYWALLGVMVLVGAFLMVFLGSQNQLPMVTDVNAQQMGNIGSYVYNGSYNLSNIGSYNLSMGSVGSSYGWGGSTGAICRMGTSFCAVTIGICGMSGGGVGLEGPFVGAVMGYDIPRTRFTCDLGCEWVKSFSPVSNPTTTVCPGPTGIICGGGGNTQLLCPTTTICGGHTSLNCTGSTCSGCPGMIGLAFTGDVCYYMSSQKRRSEGNTMSFFACVGLSNTAYTCGGSTSCGAWCALPLPPPGAPGIYSQYLGTGYQGFSDYTQPSPF